jgi:hypothetical protein
MSSAKIANYIIQLRQLNRAHVIMFPWRFPANDPRSSQLCLCRNTLAAIPNLFDVIVEETGQ